MKGNHKGNSGNSDHRSPDNIHNRHHMDEAMNHPSGDDDGTKAPFKSGDRAPVSNIISTQSKCNSAVTFASRAC